MTTEELYTSPSFQEYFKGSPQSLILRADPPKFTILAVSDAYLNLVHRVREDILGKGLLEAFPGNKDDQTEQVGVLNSLLEVMRQKRKTIQPLFKYEIRIGNTDQFDTYYWSSFHEPQMDDLGEVAFIINTTSNVTVQVAQEQALKETERRFQNMADSTDVLIGVGDETGAATYFNPAWTRLTGRSTEDLLKLGWVDLMHPDDRERVMSLLSTAINERKSWEWEFRMPDKIRGYRWLLARGIPRFLEDGSFAGYISSTVDIHEQKSLGLELLQLNEELKTSNNELAAANEDLRKIQKRLLDANSLLDESRQELVASYSKLKSSEDFLALVMESARIGTWRANPRTRSLELSVKSREIMRVADNIPTTLDQFFRWIDIRDQHHVQDRMNEASEKNRPFEAEFLLHPADGSTAIWLKATGIPAHTDREMVLAGAIIDITDQKANDQRKNDFISMVSHELKTPLTSIGGYIQVLQLPAIGQQTDAGLALLGKVKKQVDKMATLINGFLDVSRYNSAHLQLDKTRFDMALLMHESEEESLISITTHRIIFAPVERILVLADRDKIAQVITNLINNAVKYSAEGSEINVACVTREGKALISVKDEGIGIREEDLPKLFERYYRVRREENKNVSGFGIGLYVCCEIIKQHGGDIWAQSTLGKGSVFYFTIPVIE